jgi:hypothetical protein
MLRIPQYFCRHPCPIILLALPWLLLALNPNWPFGNANHCDPWFCYGHFRAYPDLYLQHPAYDGERLPGILPGYVLHLLFTPVVAQVLLHVTFFTIAICSLYYILKHSRDQRTAFLTTVLLACHAFFLGPMGWDYGDGFCIAYYLLTLAFLTRALTAPRPYPWLAFAGATSAALIYTYPLWLLFLVFFPVYYTVSAWVEGRHTFLSASVRFTLFYLLGIAIVTFAFAALSYLTVGTFHFCKWSIQTMLNLDSAPEWHNMDLGWLTRGTWIVFPVITAVGSIVYLLRTRWQDPASRDATTLLFLGNFVCCFLALSYLTFVKGRRLLEFEYYASSLIPAMFLALGSTFLRLPESNSLRVLLPTMGAAVFVCLFPFWRQCAYPDLLVDYKIVQKHPAIFNYYLLCAGAVGLLGLLGRVIRPQLMSTWIACIMALCLASFGLVPGYTKAPWIKSYHGPALYSRVTHALQTIQMHIDPTTATFFWFNLGEKGTLDYLAIHRSLRAHGTVDFNYPGLDPIATIRPESVLLILSENKDIPPAAQSVLGQRALCGKLHSQVRIAKDDISYWISFLRITRADPGISAAGQ